jgi:hypothetical protein
MRGQRFAAALGRGAGVTAFAVDQEIPARLRQLTSPLHR